MWFLSDVVNFVFYHWTFLWGGKAAECQTQKYLPPTSTVHTLGVCKHSHISFYIRVIYIEKNTKQPLGYHPSSYKNINHCIGIISISQSYLFIMLLTAYIGRRDSPDKSSDLNKYTIKSYIYLIYYVINFVKMMYQCISQ